MPEPESLINLLREGQLFEKLANTDSQLRNLLNHSCFEICVDTGAVELAEHILTNSKIILN